MLNVIYDDGRPDHARNPGEIEPARFEDGFYGEEREDAEPFRWMGLEGRLAFAPAPAERFLEMGVFSPYFDLSQELVVEAGGDRHVFELTQSWGQVSVPVPAGADGVVLRTDRLLPPEHHPGDPRQLAVRIRQPHLHGDAARHGHVSRQQRNAALNLREMLSGATELRSTPPQLGIDLHGVCNVKPPCVYCDWDVSKEMEGANVDVPFTRDTLNEWAEIFDNSSTLVNCSIGEPFMMKNLDELLDAFGEQGKLLEITTNGQVLTDRNIQKLLGRRIHLYISLDAATPETYAKLRNNKLERILANLRRLIEAKGGRAGFPKVHLVFMPMRVNVHELEAFVELCAELQVDRMILRPLNYNESAQHLDWERNGHHFRYLDELLPFEELVRVSGRAAELARRHGVELSDQLDFGGAMETEFTEGFLQGRGEVGDDASAPALEPPPATAEAAPAAAGTAAQEDAPQADGASPPAAPLPSLGEEKLPLCLEPWKSLYILRRGVLPCCYGAAPVAGMDDYRETWNSREVQAIRRELAAGRLHDYCLSSEACPIVRKHAYHQGLTPEERGFLRLRRLWHRVDALGGGVPGRLARPVKAPLTRLARRAGRLFAGAAS